MNPRFALLLVLGAGCTHSGHVPMKLTDRAPPVPVVAPSSAVDLGESPPPLVRAPGFVPVPSEKRLSNGVRLLLLERHGIPQVSVSFLLRFDPSEVPSAIPDLYASMMTGGSDSYSTRSLGLYFAAAGVNAYAYRASDTIALTATMLTPHARDVVDRLSATIASPAFETRDIDRGHRELLNARMRMRQNPSPVAVVERMLLGEAHPLRERTFAAERIRATSRDDFTEFETRYLSAENLTVVVAGDFESGEIERALEARLGRLPRSAAPMAGKASVPKESVPTTPRISIAAWRGATQSKIAFAFMGPEPKSEDRVALLILDDLLGAFAGRLQKRIREDGGASYGVGTRIERWRTGTAFVVSSSVESSRAVDAVRKIVDEIARLSVETISDDELSYAKSRTSARANDSGGSPSDADLQRGIKIASQDLPLDYFTKLAARVDAVTAEDIRAVAAKYLRTDRVQIAVAADPAVVEMPLRALGIGDVVFAPPPP